MVIPVYYPCINCKKQVNIMAETHRVVWNPDNLKSNIICKSCDPFTFQEKSL